ncbi:MAG: hypothetical protein KatS3mg061_2843 [Dehalococcoidia bacterium]|nr:MAG: hypothetical protein KatS3mg061_2843 [Dehalococcoidia bacterium]
MARWHRLGHSGLVLALLLSGWLPVARAAPPRQDLTATVEIVDDAVTRPAVVIVWAGEVVRFVNHGVIGHNVVAESGIFRLDTLAPGASAEVRFPFAGTFDFACTLHLSQRGTVVVLPTEPSPGPPATGEGLPLSPPEEVPGATGE